MSQQRALAKVYVGIDIHRSIHKAAIIPLALMEEGRHSWKKVKPLSVANCRSDFERLDRAIGEHNQAPSQVSIAIDHTGGHYSAPIINFLSRKGYQLWYLEAKALKEAKNRFLDEENKTDEIDAASMARMLCARDVLDDDLRISAVSPELSSEAATMKALCVQRWALSKLITQATYEQAVDYLESQSTPNHRIVGIDPFASPVPLEELDRYQLVYQSPSTILQSGDERVSYVEIFEYVAP